MIHFDCPNCGERMNIDSGFRGAVARCDKCGALIQVPSKHKAAPQRIERPKSPTPQAQQAAAGHAEPTRDKPRAGRSWLIAVVVVIAVIGVGAAYAWWRINGGAWSAGGSSP